MRCRCDHTRSISQRSSRVRYGTASSALSAICFSTSAVVNGAV